jgi:replicative DNA helicase
MNVDDLIAKIEAEQKKASTEQQSLEGLARLQAVAANYQGEYKLVWSDDLLKEIQARPRKTVYPTGVSLLDGIIGGFREQQLITISAATKHGKTTFGMFLVEQMHALNPVVIPLEQSNEEIVEQRQENGYSIPRFLSPARLSAQVTVEWIEHRIIEGIAKYNSKFVLIDHLGYIDNFGAKGEYKKENLAYRVGQVMRELKNVAKRWNVVIVLLVHISQKDEGKPPTMEDIKNSSDISQESDLVMMLWRKNELRHKVRVYEDRTMVSVLANRRTGRNGNIGLAFDTRVGRYREDNTWVASMERTAREQMVDDDFKSVTDPDDY